MASFPHLLRLDLRLQARSFLYPATAVSTGLICLFVALFPGDTLSPRVTAFFVFMDPATIGLSFVGAMVLAERTSGTLFALGVTPARPAAYIAAKVVSLTLLTFLSSVIVVQVATGGAYAVGLLLVALTLCSTVAVLLGLVCVAGVASMNHLVVRLLWVTTVLYLPLLAYFRVLPQPLTPLVTWIPSYAMLVAVEASVEPGSVSAIGMLAANLYLGAWMWVGWRWTVKRFRDAVITEGR
jgi:ABC-type Na+ efflux pump permease subunit